MSEVFEAAERIKAFMADDAVRDALRAQKELAYAAFIKAASDEDRIMAQALALAIDRFDVQMQALMDAGERETLEAERADRRPSTR